MQFYNFPILPEFVSLESSEETLIRPLSNNDPFKPSKLGDSRIFRQTFVRDWNSETGRSFPVHSEHSFVKPFQEMISQLCQAEQSSELPRQVSIYEDTLYECYQKWPHFERVLMNVIDRGSTFCQIARQSKIFIVSGYPQGDNFVTKPLELGLFKRMQTLAAQNSVSLTDVDFLFSMLPSKGSQVKVSIPLYNLETLSPKLKESHVSSSLSEGEKNYKLYDFPSMPAYQPSQAGYIYAMIPNFIRGMDKFLPGNNFAEHFQDLAAIERRLYFTKTKERKCA